MEEYLIPWKSVTLEISPFKVKLFCLFGLLTGISLSTVQKRS